MLGIDLKMLFERDVWSWFLKSFEECGGEITQIGFLGVFFRDIIFWGVRDGRDGLNKTGESKPSRAPVWRWNFKNEVLKINFLRMNFLKDEF